MSDKYRGSPAFPNHTTDGCDGDAGMTLRDYFAAKAIQGMLADGFIPNYVQQAEVICYDYSILAYRIADSMLKAREL